MARNPIIARMEAAQQITDITYRRRVETAYEKALERLGIESDAEFAEATGMDLDRVTELRISKHDATPEEFAVLAQTLLVTPRWLATGYWADSRQRDEADAATPTDTNTISLARSIVSG